MNRGTPGDNYNLKTAAIAAHDASYVLYRTGILSSAYTTDASDVNFYNLTLNNKLHVKGDFHVDGSMTEIHSSRLDISDGLIELATSNASDSIDIGFYGQYDGNKYTGLFRDSDGGRYQLFNNCSSQPGPAGVTGSYEYANLALNDISLSTINDGGGALAISKTGVITTVNGTLDVKQAVTLENTLTVTQDASLNGVEVWGTLDVKKAVTLENTLDVTGATTLASSAGDVNIASTNAATNVKGTLTVTQDASFNGDVVFNNNVEVSGTLGLSGDTSLDGMLEVSGNIRATADITAFYDSSDRRLKKNVETIDSALSIINNLRGVRFDWNEEAQKINKNVDLNKRELGVIAQEIEKELPEVIKNGLEGYMAVRYEKITPLLIQCIKEQQMMIKHQDERISKLENSQN